MPKPLSPREIVRYNRLMAQVISFKYALDRHKPGPAAAATVIALNRIMALANIVYSREPERQKFHPLPAAYAYTTADLAIALTPLVLAGLNFEERYEAQTRPH